MTAVREPIPEGTVSRIRGRFQVPALTWLIRSVLVISLVGGLAGGPAGRALATAAVVGVVGAPLARVCWLMLRWNQEHDRRFVALGAGVIAVIATGAVLAFLGVGG